MSIEHIVGNIPENITYFSSSTKKLEPYWENDALHAGWKGQDVTPAFCSDSTNEKTKETGRNWANGYWNHKKAKVIETNRKNDPIKGIKIIDLEKRAEGGRAYKVLTPDNFYFDLREDVLMDTMLNAGISKNGILNGTYVWARVGSEMKLVRTGSDLHKALLIATKDRTLKKLNYGNLKVGHIYKGKGKDQYIFLGYVDYSECLYTQENGRSYYSSYHYQKPPAVLTRNEVRNGLLLWKYTDRFEKEGFDFTHYFNAETKTSHSFVKDCGTVDVPKNAIEMIRNSCHKAINFPACKNEDDKLSLLAYYSPRVTVRAAGEPEVRFPGCSMIEQFKLYETITKKIK